MKRNFKSFISLLLVAMMLLCSMPLQAIAANVSSLPDATVEVLEPITLDEYTVWGGSLPAGTTEVPLQAVMKFTANDSLEEARAGKYADWICDFYLTFDGMETDSVSGVGSYLAGNYGEYGWIVIPTDSITVEKGKEYPVVTSYDPKLTYENICDYVEEFTAAIYVNPETLLANPNMTVTLALKMTDPDDPDNTITIGKPSVYTAPELYGYSKPVAKVTVLDPITLISGNYNVWTGSLSTGNADLPLQAMLNFEAVDSLEEAILGGYGDWICDFYLSFDNLEDGSVSGDGSYLAGAYGEEGAYANLGWIAIPTDGLTVVEGEEYPVVTSYDPNLTYENICDYVRNFTAALYINPETLKANPNMTVTLKLKMTNRQDENDFFYIGEPAVYTASELIAREKIEAEVTVKDPLTLESGTYDVYTGSLNKGTTDRPLQAVVHFKALDSKEEADNSFFAKWICDFYLSFDGINDPNGIYGKDCYLAGAYGEEGYFANLGWIAIPVDDVLVKEGEEYPVVTSYDPNLTYANICDYVREFTAAIYIAPEILIANPDFAVTLSLKVKDPANSDNVIVVGDPIVYTAEDLLAACDYVAINKNTNKLYDDVNLANTEAEKGETVALLTDVDVKTLAVYETLDLNGYTLKAKYVTSFGDIVDNSEDNGGLLKVSNKNFFIQSDNDQLPVNTEDGYKFVEIIKFNSAYDNPKYPDAFVFQPIFEKAANELLINGHSVSGVDIRVNVSWINAAGAHRNQNFSYTDDFIKGFFASAREGQDGYNEMFTLALSNVTKTLTYQVQVVSDKGVVFASEATTVQFNENNTTNEDITINNAEADTASAFVPQGTMLSNGATSSSLKLTVSEVTDSESNVTLQENEVKKSVDVHIDGISEDNTVPMIITLKEFAEKGINEGNLSLYHVENGNTVKMTQVFTASEVDAHNEFYYDPATGNVVMALASFSEVTLVNDTDNAWNGKFDYSWYTNAVTLTDGEATADYVIANADQLAAFGAIVGGMNGKTQDSFAGKTVKLIADVNLGDKEAENNPDIIFYPIGYYNSEGIYEKTNAEITSGFYTFEGTFDGNGHTISNFYQNTWEMKGDNNYYDATLQYYRDGMGLFGKVYGGTVKNLTVDSFSSDGEYTTTGVIAAYADSATFENIAITNCNPRVYNIGNGGIAGCVGWYAKEANLTTTFKNITVDNSNKISALWGSYDVACGGIVGQYYPTSGQTSVGTPKNAGIHFENCHVSAIMDVYNDVCGNYQYYAYRYAGMIIGSIRENTTNTDGKTIPDMTGISATGCTVNYGDWNDYYYCEFEKNGHPSYSGPDDYKFSRVPHSELNFTDSNGNGLVDANERASVTGCKHDHTAAENNTAIYLPFHQLFTGYGWGVSSIGLEKYSGIVTNLDITEGDNEESVEKFETKFTGDFLYRVGNKNTVSIGSLFAAKDGATINTSGVWVTVEKVDDEMNVSGTFKANTTTANTTTANTTDWTKGTIQFSGTGVVKVTIQDYNFCTPTVLYLEVVDATNVTTAAFSGNSVLLNDVSTSSALSTSGVIYGNGFTVNMENAPISDKNGAVFHLYDGAVLKNLSIIGKEFTSVAMNVNDTNYGVSAVRAWGTVTIENCYISGCRSAVSVTGTELTIKDSVIANGVYANVDFRSGILNLHNVTTINEPHAVNGTTIVGLGIVGNMTASAGRQINITGTLTQYNWLSQADCANIKASGVDSIFKSVFTDSKYASLRYTYNGTTYVNTGILSLCSDFGASAVVGVPSNYGGMDVTATISNVTVNGYVWAPAQAGTLTDGDMKYHDSVYAWDSSEQGTSFITPSFNFADAGLEAENGVVQISYESGSSYTLTAEVLKKLMTPQKYGKTLGYSIYMNGEEINGDVVIDAAASNTYTITYKITDNLVFDKLGVLSAKTYEITKDLSIFATVVDKAAAAPTFTFYYGTKGNASAGTPHTTQPTTSYTGNIKQIGEEYYIMPNVSATTANEIGSQTVDGMTVYYPIVDGINVRSGSSSDYDFTRYYPVFKAVKISDNGTEYTYGVTKEMPATVTWVSATIDSGNGASSLNDGFGLYNNQYLCKIQKKAGNAESGGTSVVKYSYTALDGNTYYYYVGYRFYDEDEGGVCVTPDTLVTLADGSQKRVDTLSGDEMLMVWNHETGSFDAVPVAYIVDHEGYVEENIITHLYFDNGYEIKIIGEHVFFDSTLNKYVAITSENAEAYIGHNFTVKSDDALATAKLVKVDQYTEVSAIYEVVSYKHITCFTNNILSASAYMDQLLNIFDIDSETMAYNAEDVQKDIETYGLYTYADFDGLIEEEAFELYNAKYLKIAVGKGYITWDDILNLIDIYFGVNVQPIQ